MEPERVLIAEDEPSIRKVLRALLERAGYEVEAVEDGEAAMERLRAATYHALVTDLKMPRVDGLALLAWCRVERPALPVIVITAFGSVDSAVEALKLGAFDYITKPFDQDELKLVVEKAMSHQRLERQAAQAHGGDAAPLIGSTRSMAAVYDLIRKVASSPATVLIQGESGTGKGLVARALHEASGRTGSFIHVNCGAIPENLFESELFGYEKGAFTGAASSKPGRFELADKGTLLLDEVGELPRDMQVKLLRVLQERTFERVGGVRSITVDARVLAASNVDLTQRVGAGQFREDLYYRLNVVPVVLPPLRERRDDIPLLAGHFLGLFNRRFKRNLAGISPSALDLLLSWRWPGNVRELENVMERAVLLAEGPSLEAGDISGLVHGPSPAPTAGHGQGLDLKEYLRRHTCRLERARIQEALEMDRGNVTRAARRLGISRKSLQNKMKEYGFRHGLRTVAEP